MRALSYLHRYVGGQMACRSLRPFSASEKAVLTIPGGPGLGGAYLEPFLIQLASETGFNVALLDLPNHGESVLAKDAAPLDYPRTVEMIHTAVRQAAKETGGIMLFGQSLGARLAFDIIAREETRVPAVLTGFPCRFENSSELLKRLADVPFEDCKGSPEDEEIFARNWRKVLSYYTARPLSRDDAERLSSGTKWRGNERMLEGVLPLEDVAAKVRDRGPEVLIIQGARDAVVPDGNLKALKECLPSARIAELPDAGHFVMVEQPQAALKLIADFLKKAEARA